MLNTHLNKPVTQSHPMGCAVACVAYILNVSYQRALTLFEKQSAAWIEGYYCEDIVRALKKYSGHEYAFEKVAEGKLEQFNNEKIIVFCDRCAKYPEGHYLVKEGKTWMNPWVNYPIITPAKAGFLSVPPSKPTWFIYSKFLKYNYLRKRNNRQINSLLH